MTADFRVLDYVTTPGSPVSTKASFAIQDGVPGRQVEPVDTLETPSEFARLWVPSMFERYAPLKLKNDGGSIMVELKRIYWGRQALRLTYSAVLVWLSISVIQALLPKPKAVSVSGTGISAATEVLRGMLDSVLAAVALPGAFLVVLLIVAAILHSQDVRRRDPIRRFTRQQRREGMARAAGLCEMEAAFRRRCSRAAEHGDHFYPWSKGGSTSLQNFVAACARCNRRKGARIPSPGRQERIQRRRRDYVLADGPVSVGERQPLP
ncbi:HNH endonuclease [Burkholderia sp. RS01]|uniref:HNH endonuclease n=1 Tax=unclassified Burkholderia TaxID=2613784 RepID=UPI0032184684